MTCSRCGCTTRTSRTASACTGTASTCPTPRTASPASPRTPSARARTTSTGSSSTTPARYWYHSHQVSHTQVIRGLFGPLVVQPAETDRRRRRPRPSPTPTAAPAPSTARRASSRSRTCPTARWPGCAWSTPTTARSGCGPRAVQGARRRRARHQRADAGGRAQRVAVPAGRPVRPGGRRRPPASQVGGSTALVLGEDPGASRPAARRPRHAVVRRAGGAALRPGRAPTACSATPWAGGPASSTASPACWWSINGHLWPDVPMYLVDEGDVVLSWRSRTTAARCTPCTSTATTPWSSPATASRRPAARGGSTRSTSRTTRP